MDPRRTHGDKLNPETVTEADDDREDIRALLQEGLDSGLSDQSWDSVISELNLKYFGKEKI